MANIKITDLTAYTDAASTDVLPIVDVSADVTKKIAIGDIVKAVPQGTAALPGLAFDGDPNTGLFSAGADQVAISTNGTGRLFVDASGRVGIGQTSPGTSLHVGPGVQVLTPDGAGVLFTPQMFNSQTSGVAGVGVGVVDGANNRRASFFVDHTNGIWGLGASYTSGEPSFVIRTPTERMRIDSSGRLLVGTSSQSGGSLFQVNDDRIRIASSKTPASASDTGTAGEICWDSSYIYVCTATDTWKRAALSTW
jgi:hypothetical protein